MRSPCPKYNQEADAVYRNTPVPNYTPGTNDTAIHRHPDANNTPRASMGGTTNANNNPQFGHTLHGNTGSFSPATYIHNNQCQHVNGDSHSGCTIYQHQHSPASHSSSRSQPRGGHHGGESAAGRNRSDSQLNTETEAEVRSTINTLNAHLPPSLQSRLQQISPGWVALPWALLSSLVQFLIGARVPTVGIHNPILIRNACEYDLEAQVESGLGRTVAVER